MPEHGRDTGEEEALIDRFRGGDKAAFQLLVERYEAMLTARVEGRLPRRLRRRMAVSDVLQESLLAAYDHREDLRDGSAPAFRSWLLTIAERKVHDAIRRHEAVGKRDMRREVPRGRRGETSGLPGRQATPSQAAMGAETRALARRVMAHLPPDYREVLRLAQHEHLNLAEVAERMGRSHAAVRKLYGRALARFREDYVRRGGTQR